MDLRDLLLNTTPGLIDLSLLTGRIALGICFVVHGLGKLGVVGPGSMAGFVGFLKENNIPVPELQARMAMLSELTGGVFLALGLFTRPVCAMLTFTMLIAATVGHRGGGYLVTNDPPGNEYPINLAVMMVMFLLLGPGRLSLDAILF